MDDEAAAFTVPGAIALQGLRLASPTLGEAVVVTGLGLIGLLTVQLLRAQGCRVLGIDYVAERLALARQFGAEVVDLSQGEDPRAAAAAFSRGRGVDAVLITAATDSNEPVHQAAQMCRQRGRIVLVGVAGLELSRADFYEKELSFQVSCSYGPGRYDPAYEERGQDYPTGYVRWTAQRNFEAVLDMLAAGRLDVKPLITHRFAFDDALQAYELLGGDAPSLGIVLEYPDAPRALAAEQTLALPAAEQALPTAAREAATAVVGFIGAGNHAGRVLMPAFKRAGAVLHTLASTGGATGMHHARKFGFREATTDVQRIFEHPEINTVVIATRHDTHAGFTCRALAAGKHVYVEKPLALTLEQLQQVQAAWQAAGPEGQRPVLMVGFNRRYSPHARRMRELLAARPEPKAFVMTVNAGRVPPGHWSLDPQVGGGRIIGEACHFIDLLRFLAGSPITTHHITRLGGEDDSATITLGFADGSLGTIHYLANGARRFPKERLEVFCAGGILRLDNFRKLRGYGWPGFSRMNLWRQDKGATDCIGVFVRQLSDAQSAAGEPGEAFEASRVSLEAPADS